MLQPNEPKDGFDVHIDAGNYDVEWHSVSSRETKAGPALEVEKDSKVRFTSPFTSGGSTVLYLKAR